MLIMLSCCLAVMTHGMTARYVDDKMTWPRHPPSETKTPHYEARTTVAHCAVLEREREEKCGSSC